MFHAVEVHILERIYLCETVAVVDASGAFDKMGVFAAVIFGKIAAAGEKGHLKFAGYDYPCLRNVRCGREIEVGGVAEFAVGCAVGCAGVDADILVGTVWYGCVRPAGAIDVIEIAVYVVGVGVVGVETETGADWSDFRKIDNEFGSRPCDCRSVAGGFILGKGPVGDFGFCLDCAVGCLDFDVPACLVHLESVHRLSRKGCSGRELTDVVTERRVAVVVAVGVGGLVVESDYRKFDSEKFRVYPDFRIGAALPFEIRIEFILYGSV